MKLSARGKSFLTNNDDGDGHFLEELERSLVEEAKTLQIGPHQFQRVYKNKKVLSETIDEYRQKNKYCKEDILKAKQRIYQISQLNDKANKQSILMRNQINKINEAHMMSKILMMEKIVRLGIENQDMQKKRIQCHRVRQGKQRANSIGRFMHEKKQRTRQRSMMESKALKSCIQDSKYQTIQDKRSRADKVRSQKERRRQRLARYEKFKLDQAKKNYLSKTQGLIKTLQEKEKLLDTLFVEEAKQQKHFQTTEQVTKQYLASIYPTISETQDQSYFPTQTI